MADNRFVLDRSWSSVFASSGNLRILDGTKDKGQKVRFWEIRLRQVKFSGS